MKNINPELKEFLIIHIHLFEINLIRLSVIQNEDKEKQKEAIDRLVKNGIIEDRAEYESFPFHFDFKSTCEAVALLGFLLSFNENILNIVKEINFNIYEHLCFMKKNGDIKNIKIFN